MRMCIRFQQGARTCAIDVRHEWHCGLPSVSYGWQPFSSAISHLLSLLQSVALLACSLHASPCVPAVVLSVQFSRSVMSDSLWPHGLQQARPPCPSPTPGAYSNSCPLNRWCHQTTSSSVIPFSSCPQSFPASGAFQMSQFFASGSQSIGVSATTSVLPMNIQDWFPLGWAGLISLLSKELSRVFSNTTSWASLSCFQRENHSL